MKKLIIFLILSYLSFMLYAENNVISINNEKHKYEDNCIVTNETSESITIELYGEEKNYKYITLLGRAVVPPNKKRFSIDSVYEGNFDRYDFIYIKTPVGFITDYNVECKHDDLLFTIRSYETVEKILEDLKIKLISRGKEINSPIVILYSDIIDINSAGGVSSKIDFINISEKKIKYVNFDLIPYNRVYDQAYSEIGGESVKTVQVVNFISPNDYYNAVWKNVWYNSTIAFMNICKIEIIFDDNTRITIDEDKINNIMFDSEESTEYQELIKMK